MNDIEKAKNQLIDLKIWLDDNKEHEGESIEAIDVALHALQKQLNSGWIPVSERLPSEEECNRFDIRHPNRRKFLCTVKIGDYEPQVRELCFSIFYQWEYYSENYTKYVIAWQPLPEPWKEEISDGENYLQG